MTTLGLLLDADHDPGPARVSANTAGLECCGISNVPFGRIPRLPALSLPEELQVRWLPYVRRKGGEFHLESYRSAAGAPPLVDPFQQLFPLWLDRPAVPQPPPPGIFNVIAPPTRLTAVRVPYVSVLREYLSIGEGPLPPWTLAADPIVENVEYGIW